MKQRFLAPAALVFVVGTLGCHDFTEASGGTRLVGTLSLEIRHTADLQIAVAPDGVGADVSLTLSEGFGVAPAASALRSAGRVEPVPEAGATLYTARLSAPAQPDGPCGAEPVSLALSLHRQGDNAVVHGGLTAYCGADQWHGIPPRVLRLAGELPLE